MRSKSIKMVFVASIIRQKLCMIYAFFDFFFAHKLFSYCWDKFYHPGSIAYLSCFTSGAIIPKMYLKISFLRIQFSRLHYPRPTESFVKALPSQYTWFGSLFRTNIHTHTQTHRQTEFYDIIFTSIRQNNSSTFGESEGNEI